MATKEMNKQFKANFQEQNKHNPNESDISDEDFGDIDENIVRTQKLGQQQAQVKYGYQQQLMHNQPYQKKEEKKQIQMIQKINEGQQSSYRSQQQINNMHINQKMQYEDLRNYQNEEQDPEQEADFEKAYQKLIQKYYMEHGNNMLIPDMDIDKINQQKFNANEVQKRIQEMNQRKEEKILIMKQIQAEKEMEDCTFAPQIYKKKQEEKRDINRFLEDQKKYEEMRQLKQNMRKERQLQEEQSIYNNGPQVSSKSKQLLENRTKKQEERQHSEEKQKYDKQMSSQMKKRVASPQPKQQFQPQILKKSKQIAANRQQKIEDHLLLEGQKAKIKQQQKEEEEKKKPYQKQVNQKNETLILKKFEREFIEKIKHILEVDEISKQQFKESQLNYLKLQDILVSLGMFDENQVNIESVQRVLLYDFWKILKGEDNQTVNLDDVYFLIISILRMTDSKRIKEDQSESQEIGFYNEKKQFCLRQEDLNKVHKHFNLLYISRLQYIGKVIDMKNQQKYQQNDINFKPKLNENSTQIAQQYRQKIADQINESNISTFDWLSVAGNKEEWRKQAKEILDKEEMKECTFKPELMSNKINDITQRSIMNESKQSISTQYKHEQLYQLSKNQKAKQDKTKEEYEYERQKDECTFQPKLQNKNLKEENSNIVEDKFVQKQLDRLTKAREEKERIKLFMEKGIVQQKEQKEQKQVEPIKKEEKIQSKISISPNKQQMEQQNEESPPLLFVDVNLGEDQQERIVVYEGDTANGLAQKFCESHNLDEDTQEKLEELLVEQMQNVLTKIEEEEI